MNATEFYEAGQLNEAIAALNEDVKTNPTDQSRRGFLCELLCYAGNLERADKLLETMLHQDPEAAVGISMFRQIIRAEQARRQFYDDGRVPEVLDEPSPVLRLHLQAPLELREGQTDEAYKLLQDAEEQRPTITGTCDGKPFEGLRDLDDLTAPLFEVLTSTGKYYWIPMERVESIEFHAPVRPLDLLFRRAHMVVQGGPDGEVFLPAIYAGSHEESDDRIRLGRATDWHGEDGELIRGIGQRTFLIGDEERPILGITEIIINQPGE
jgi:type VI secretion system protein ImpE